MHSFPCNLFDRFRDEHPGQGISQCAFDGIWDWNSRHHIVRSQNIVDRNASCCYVNEQYIKPYLVCHWAQFQVDGARNVMQWLAVFKNNFRHLEGDTFQEAVSRTTNCLITT